MSLGRRTFLKSVGLATLATPFARAAWADPAPFAPTPGAMRTFELVTQVDIANAAGPTRVWIPMPSHDLGDWFAAHDTTFTGNAKSAALGEDKRSGVKFVEAAWDGGSPTLQVVSRFSTRDRAVDPAHPGKAQRLSAAERAQWLRATKLVPTDGIVKATSDSIVGGATTDLAKTRAIYEWVVENTYRDPATRGCGAGDVVSFLKSRPMGGKCADINRLFVGLVRAAGIPARELYGIRVAPSRFGYKALGANSATVTKSQHCRSEVHLDGIGWFPVDPADVRKVALEEPPGHLDMSSDKVVAARKTLFGAWETNWVPYNNAQDVKLSGSDGDTIPFLMYPQAEVAGQRSDCLDPDKFRYVITAREIT